MKIYGSEKYYSFLSDLDSGYTSQKQKEAYIRYIDFKKSLYEDTKNENAIKIDKKQAKKELERVFKALGFTITE